MASIDLASGDPAILDHGARPRPIRRRTAGAVHRADGSVGPGREVFAEVEENIRSVGRLRAKTYHSVTLVILACPVTGLLGQLPRGRSKSGVSPGSIVPAGISIKVLADAVPVISQQAKRDRRRPLEAGATAPRWTTTSRSFVVPSARVAGWSARVDFFGLGRSPDEGG